MVPRWHRVKILRPPPQQPKFIPMTIIGLALSTAKSAKHDFLRYACWLQICTFVLYREALVYTKILAKVSLACRSDASHAWNFSRDLSGGGQLREKKLFLTAVNDAKTDFSRWSERCFWVFLRFFEFFATGWDFSETFRDILRFFEIFGTGFVVLGFIFFSKSLCFSPWVSIWRSNNLVFSSSQPRLGATRMAQQKTQ